MKINLYNTDSECCGCGACMNICPKSAISMKENRLGFIYPEINEDRCIHCKLCKKVCAYQNVKEMNTPIATYVATTKNTDILKSASGGIFASIAKSIINDNGIVYGASMEFEENRIIIKHIGINSIKSLYKLQGSKYIQSEIGEIFKDIKSNLEASKLVLFSGTPCQVAGLKSYLNKDYANLLTIDIVCHGVPSNKMFNDYIKMVEEKLKGHIISYCFRDKKNGWGLSGRFEYIDNKGNIKAKSFEPWESSYYELFLNSDIYRENCYSCKYASMNRPSDITLGDFWGVEEEHFNLLEVSGGTINEKNGVSGIVINTKKGSEYLNRYKSGLVIYNSSFNKMSKHNGQLNSPSKMSNIREEILKKYKEDGYLGIEKWFIRQKGIKLKLKKVVKRVKVVFIGE